MEKSEGAKRKTHTSSAVKARYNAKTYARYMMTLRRVEDREIIAAIEAAKAEGIAPTEFFRAIYKKQKSGNSANN
ncbi:MAG: hypothetical protein NC237_04420 [Eubacterium sp.]|nr:hypothetical protein [Eubacterium sp.]MCM1419289.1 hypothetical protein [Roseburia sp.]